MVFKIRVQGSHQPSVRRPTRAPPEGFGPTSPFSNTEYVLLMICAYFLLLFKTFGIIIIIYGDDRALSPSKVLEGGRVLL